MKQRITVTLTIHPEPDPAPRRRVLAACFLLLLLAAVAVYWILAGQARQQQVLVAPAHRVKRAAPVRPIPADSVRINTLQQKQ